MKKKLNKTDLTEEMQAKLKERCERFRHLIIQAECSLAPYQGRTYIVVRSIHDFTDLDNDNMIDVTDEFKSFMWTGNPTASQIISEAIKKSADEDDRLA